MRFAKYHKLYISLILFVAVIGFYTVKAFTNEEEQFSSVSAEAVVQSLQGNSSDYSGMPSYMTVRNQEINDISRAVDHPSVIVNAVSYSNRSADAVVEIKPDREKGKEVLSWNNGNGWIEWEVDIPADGPYQLRLDYKSLKKGFTSIHVGLEIDGKSPFREAKSIELVRNWKDLKFPYARNVLGDEIRSEQEEIDSWKTEFVTDYAVSSEPLIFHLTKGSHSIKLSGLNESLDLGEIHIQSPESIPTYEEYVQSHAAAANENIWFQMIEAEQYLQKSHPSIQTGNVQEPYVSPDPQGRLVYNVIDGNRWKKAGQWIEWAFEVPETGTYEIDLKYFQRYQGKSNVYRTMMIDGKVPFKELLHYTFPYNNQLEVQPLHDEQGKPYRFYLDKGKHVLRAIVDASPLDPALQSLSTAIRDLRKLEQSVRQITGNYGEGIGDANRTWDIDTYIPNIYDKLQHIKSNLTIVKGYLNGMNQHSTDATSALSICIRELADFIDDVNEIPNKMNKFADIQSRLSGQLDSLSEQALMVDYIVVRTPLAKPDLKQSTVFAKIPYAMGNFVRTFFMDYNLGKFATDHTLKVWVGRGRDYVNLLQEMIDQQFTPATGIRVNVNLMPDPNALILGNAAGDHPDVALGVGQDAPVDYAMREAVVDLTRFDGFDEAALRFHPGVLRSFSYKQGVYALPETQSYKMLFYRKSILEQLETGVPQTWEDVYALLPSLQEKGMAFYYPAKEFAPFFYQNGAEFYTSDGLEPALNEEKSYAAFEQWTDLFAKYDLPKEVPAFFHHFKLGDIPIGIADFNTYIQLLAAAPEIRDDWGIAPIPGVKQTDGTIARWIPNELTAGMIMSKSNKKEEAWRFLDWWTSTDTQIQFGNHIESFYGIEYRWNTANLQALASLSWPADHLKVIREQNRWSKNIPVVPGSYYLSRELDFAWNQTVLGGVPANESLEKSFISLEREMKRKQMNLNLSPSDQFNIPSVEMPYDWRGE